MPLNGLGRLIALIGLIMIVVACGSEGEDNFVERMAEEHEEDIPSSNVSSEGQPTGEDVIYATIDGEEISGYLATASEEEAPGVIVIHEWWGLNDNIKAMTEKLAGQGYTALAVDLYEGEVADSPDRAKTLTGSVEDDRAKDNLGQAFDYLESQEEVSSIGTLGWCFGGGWSLQAALAHPDRIDATVIYYGQPVTEGDRLEDLDMPVLGIFGAEDEGIPVEQVRQFESVLNELDVENTIHIYEGADHAFANPSGERYDKKAAEDAWQKTIAFLDQHLNEN